MRTGLSLLIACLLTAGLASAQRVTIPLDGEWQIEDSLSPDSAPTTWRHSAQVPGMANLAKPGFPDDQFRHPGSETELGLLGKRGRENGVTMIF